MARQWLVAISSLESDVSSECMGVHRLGPRTKHIHLKQISVIYSADAMKSVASNMIGAEKVEYTDHDYHNSRATTPASDHPMRPGTRSTFCLLAHTLVQLQMNELRPDGPPEQ